jgi:hypothetical protein
MGKSFIESINRLMRRVPGRVWLAVGSLLVAAFWLQQHDARIRQQAEVQQLRNQTSAAVAALRKQAARDVKQANVENAKAIAKLEQRRQQVEQQNRQLAAQLVRLRKQAQIQAGEVATLPISEIVTRVATQLGLKAGDLAGKEEATSRKGAKAQGKLQITNDELPGPGATSAPPQPADFANNAKSAPPDGESVALPLTSSGARKVETALVELRACRAESNIETQQISGCQARAEADAAKVERLNASVGSLNQAIDAKDKILDRQAGECKAELRAARGTFLGRLARLTEHVAVGLAVGVAIGVAVK